MRISDWSSDVCSSDLTAGRTYRGAGRATGAPQPGGGGAADGGRAPRLQNRTPRSGRTGSAVGTACRPHRKRQAGGTHRRSHGPARGDRQSVVSGKMVTVRVDPVGPRLIKKKKQ